METAMTLSPANDPMGQAILDFQRTGKAGRLSVLSSMFDDDEMPVPHLFRTYSEMPPLEQTALRLARGRVLDVGAGAGCHTLALQQQNEKTGTPSSVMALDISPLSCEAMSLRGCRNVVCQNLFAPVLREKFDTILMLMNGTGIAGKASRLPALLSRLKELLCEGGQILIDSSDLVYLFEDEDGNAELPDDGTYYGEVDYQMVYEAEGIGTVVGKPFDWLYADYNLLATAAKASGLNCKLVQEGDHYDYLARLSR